MSRPISTWTSSVWTMIFRILAGMVAPGDATLAQTVPLADVGGCQAADAGVDAPGGGEGGMEAGAGGHGQDDDEFIGRRRAGHAQLDGVEVAAHIAGVDMGQRHIQRATRRADL